jgi:hypothetical protein
MSPWQHSVRKKLTVWGRFLLASATVHLMFLTVLFFMQDGDHALLQISMQKKLDGSDAKIVVLPFHRVAPAALRSAAGARGGVKSAKTRSSAGTAKMAQAKPAKAQRTRKKPATALRTKSDSKKQLTAKNKQKKALIEQKKSQSIAHKKNEQKRATKEQPKKGAEKVREQPVKEPVVPIAPHSNDAGADHAALAAAEAVSAVSGVGQTGVAPDDVVYVGQAEMDALRIQQEIQKEIEAHWKPPAGLGAERSCQIKIVVDWQGKAHALDMIKPSGLLLYDVSARNAVLAMSFPSTAFGKELVITFS